MTFLIALITPKWFSSTLIKKLSQKTLKTRKTQVCHTEKLAVFNIFADFFQYFLTEYGFECCF